MNSHFDRRVFIGGSVALAALSALPARASGSVRQISVDARKKVGRIRSLQGTNSFPLPLFTESELQKIRPGWHAYGKNNEFVVALSSADLTNFMREARIDFARTHDAFGPGDIDVVFEKHPALAERRHLAIFPDMSADPADPDSYNFGPTDELVRSILERDLKLVFRIGRSIWGGAKPPSDFAKYAEIVRQIVRHYNQGWANGFQYGINHWEIWNEPDLDAFWDGISAEYFRFYQLCANAIKSVDPALKVGGPTIAFPIINWNFVEDFMRFVKDNKLPLDFFSYHDYPLDSNDPYNHFRISRQLREHLDRMSFGKTELFLDEWNCDFAQGSETLSEAGRAAYVASSLIYMQNSPIDRAFYYGRVGDASPTGFKIDQVGQAITFVGALNDTPHRLFTTGEDNRGFAVLAGSDEKDGIQVLVSNYQIPERYRDSRQELAPEDELAAFFKKQLPRIPTAYLPSKGYELDIRGLDDNASYEIFVQSIADSGSGHERYLRKSVGAALRIKRIVPAQTVALVRLTKV